MAMLLAGLLGFLLIAVGSHADAAHDPEQYWKSALPNTPMPSSLSQLLNTPAAGGTSSVKVKPGSGWTNSNILYDSAATEEQLQDQIFIYDSAATKTQLHDHAGVALYFLEKDIHPGKKLTLHFTRMATTDGGKLLPRSEADAIPFSSEKLPEILSRFSVNPGSVEAAEMAQTLHDCERLPNKGEKAACATSLESMVDFATSSLGTSHVRAVSTIVGKEGSPKQEYTVTKVKRIATGGTDQQLVACHAEPYAYAVFACHLTQATRAYAVSVVGKDGTAAEAVAVCHADTASWNPRHLAFQVLKVKPGTVPVCHFVPQDSVVWTRSA